MANEVDADNQIATSSFTTIVTQPGPQNNPVAQNSGPGLMSDVASFLHNAKNEYAHATDVEHGGFNSRHLQRTAAVMLAWAHSQGIIKKPDGVAPSSLAGTPDAKSGAPVSGEHSPTPDIPGPLSNEAKAAIAVTATEAAAGGKTPSKFTKANLGKYGTVGLSAYGVYAGAKGFKRSYNEGDGLGMTVNGANVAVSGTDLTLNVMKAAGKADKILGAVKFLDKANVVLNVVDIGYETYKEDGHFVDRDADGNLKAGHKTERLIASSASAVAGMGGFAAGTALAGVVGGAVILPAAAALADAYLVNKAANTIIDTRRTYEDVDKTFRPDQKRHSNFVGAMARVLGNDASNKSLQEAGVKVDPETGRVSMTTLNAALADPQEGPYAMGRLKALIGNISAADKSVPEPHMPRWIQFTDAQRDARQKYEYAKMDARSMDSAQVEADGYVAELKQKRADAATKAQADLDAKMKPFNALPPEVQEDITSKLQHDYPAYKQQMGDKAVDEAQYIAAGKITAAGDKQLVDRFVKAEADLKPFVDYVADKQLADWKKQNPAASAGDIEAERKQIVADTRHEAITDGASFQKKIDAYKAADQSQPQTDVQTAPVQEQPGPQRTTIIAAQRQPKTNAPA